MDINKLLISQAQKYQNKPAILFNDKEISFSQLKDNSFCLANYLKSKGIKSGDKVALFFSNTPQAIYSFLAVFSIGGCVVPLDFMLTEEEIIHFINHSQAKILIGQSRKGIDFNNIKKQCASLQEIVISQQPLENLTYLEAILENQNTQLPKMTIASNSLAAIFYTSGSTGKPKGVMLNYSHLDNPVQSIDHFLQVSDKDIYLCGGVPFSHFGGLDYILLMLYFGSTLVLMERFNPLEFLKNLAKYKVSIFCIVPAMYVAILSLKEYDGFDLSSLRYAVVFGAPSSPALLSRFKKAYPKAKLLNGWGMTETAAPNAFSPDDMAKIASIGKFDFNLKAKLIDDDGKDALQGELLVKGDAVMTGYYKSEDLTKEVLTSDDWLKTGDIARRDFDGLYYLCGRKKDMLKVAGEIVFCAEVEEKIALNLKIKEVAIVGVEDKLRGEVPKAYIALKDNEKIEIQELKDFLKIHLAHFKIPHYFEFVKELPKNRVGKVDKQALRATQMITDEKLQDDRR